MLVLPTLKNLTSYDVAFTELDPYFNKPRPYYGEPKKKSVIKWWSNRDTNWIFYSGFSCLNPTARARSENPVYKMHAFIVDYDCEYNYESLIKHLQSLAECGGVTPNYCSRTFQNRVRMVWSFEEPVRVVTDETGAEMILQLLDDTLARNAYPGLDQVATKNVRQYYELGQDWIEFEDIPPISSKKLHRLLYNASCKSSKYFHRDVAPPKIPLDIIYEELTLRFPGRWTGPFDVNSRGPRFWVEDADADSAIVREEGMTCFTGDAPFVSWSEIFGRQFVDKFLDDKIGAVMEYIFTDGKTFFIYNPTQKRYFDYSTDQVRWHLSAQHGMINSKEQNLILNRIMDINRVDAAFPIVHRPQGIIELNGKRILNLYKSQIVLPSQRESEIIPSQDFPFIHRLWFENGFDPQEQLNYFLAWLKRWYISALENKPAKGQILIISGPPSAGKSFTNQYILGSIFGVAQDASRFFLENINFSGHMYEAPLWFIDDNVVSSSYAKQMFYTSMLKKIAADSRFEFNEKYRKATMAEWHGRVVITCNEDPESLSAVPQLTISNDNKVMLLKMADNYAKFIGVNCESAVAQELPYFLKWLLDWEPPFYTVDKDPRYGIVPFKHPDLFEEARLTNDVCGLDELLDVYMSEWFESTDVKITELKLRTSELLERLQSEGSPVSSASRHLNMVTLGKELRKLEAKNNPKFKRILNNGRNMYIFYRDKCLSGLNMT